MTPEPQHQREERWKRLLTAESVMKLTFISVLLAYLQTITFDFVYDDFGLITMNPWRHSWRSIGPIFSKFSMAYLPDVPARHYRPIYMLWIWTVSTVFGDAPGWFHLASMFTHLAACYLAYRLARRLLRNDLAGALAALLFAVHPTKIEGVAWVAAAGEALQAVLVFATLLLYLRFRETRKALWMVATCALFAAALLTKETSVVIPLIIVIYESTIAPARGERLSIRDAMVSAIPFAAILASFLLLRYEMLSGLGDTVANTPVLDVILTAPLAIWLYLRQMLLPFNLSPVYPYVFIRSFAAFGFILPSIALLLFAGAYFYFARHSAVLKFAAGWFVVTLLPVIAAINWLQLHDRHLYLPSFGVSIAIISLLRRVRLGSLDATASRALIVVCASLVLTVTTAFEVRVWETSISLFTRAVDVAPRNAEAVEGLANAYEDLGSNEMAEATLLRGYQLVPESPRLTYAIGTYYYEHKRYKEALPYLERALSMPQADYRRAATLFEISRIEWSQTRRIDAREHLLEAIALWPRFTSYRTVLAEMDRELGEGVTRKHPTL